MKTAHLSTSSNSPSQQTVQPKSNEPVDIKDWCVARADAWYQQHNPDLARTFLQFALDIDPYDASIWIALGSLQFTAGKLAPALLAFNQANELTPQNHVIQLHLALTHQHLGEGAQAEWYFRQALELHPEHVGALKLYAGYLMACHRFSEARLHLEQALSTDLDDVETFLRLGVCCFQTSDLAAAKACFKRVLHLEPAHVTARENLAVIEADQIPTMS